MSKRDLRKIITSLMIIVAICITTVLSTFLEPTKGSEKTQESMKIEGDNLKVYFLDVGQADSILIQDKNEFMLIDAGNNEDGEKLVEYFKSLGITKFKYVIGTHPHEDHIGGMDNIINNFDIEKYYMPDAITTTKTFESVLDALGNKNLQFDVPKEDEVITLNNATIKFLHSEDGKSDLNDTSIVLKMTYGNKKFLFTGDATSNVEKKIINKDISCDVLKVGHHGSQYSTTENFLEKTDPIYAIISVGKNNTYKHPREETLNKLKERNIKVYRTDQDGTIIATTDGEEIKFETIKTDLDGE